MATNPKMAERIKREAPRCKYIRNVETDEIYRNTGNPMDHWLIVYEHALKNPETFERIFHEAKTADGTGGETYEMLSPGALIKKSVPTLRTLAGSMGVSAYSNLEKNDLIKAILAKQEENIMKLQEES